MKMNKELYYSGVRVKKISQKPFKSGSCVNTIKDIVTHKETGLPGYSFIEDDSIVECRRVVALKGTV